MTALSSGPGADDGPHFVPPSTIALAGVYGTFGVFWGTWGVVFADYVSARDLGFGTAGNLLASHSLVAVVAMVLIAPRLESVARERVVTASIGLHAIGAILMVTMPSPWLFVAFGVAGAGTGLVDVFVNTAGQEHEAAAGRPVLQRLHATLSFGTALGAVTAGSASSAGIGWAATLLSVAVAEIAAAAAGLRWVVDIRGSRDTEATPAISLTVFRAVPFLLIPALALAVAWFVEGSVIVWAVAYLRESLGASAGFGSWGLAAFATALATGRLFAAQVLFHLGGNRTLMVSGAGSLAAGIVVVASNDPILASVALLFLGAFVGAASPAAIGMIGRTGLDVGVAVAAISTLGYTGIVLGPPLLGWLADVRGLHLTMAVIVLSSLGIGVSGLLARRQLKPTTDTAR